MKVIVPQCHFSPADIDDLAMEAPLEIALTIVAKSHNYAKPIVNLKKRLPAMRRKAKASLAQLATLLK
jgi:hypothetical protein